MTKKTSQEAVVDNISWFVAFELRKDFPELNGCYVGVTPGVAQRLLNNKTGGNEEEFSKATKFVILAGEGISKRRMAQIRKRLAEEFFDFIVAVPEPV